MATTENGIYYPGIAQEDYQESADILDALKKLADSVDANMQPREEGKGLSENNYSNGEKQKVTNNTTNIATLQTESGHTIELNLNTTNYVLSVTMKNKAGTVVSTDNVDFPVELLMTDLDYDEDTKELIITLQNGQTRRIGIEDIVEGLVSQTDFDELEDSALQVDEEEEVTIYD